MYSFVLNMYRMGRIETDEVARFAQKGFITQEEAGQITDSAKV